jgi:hypothetical protein
VGDPGTLSWTRKGSGVHWRSVAVPTEHGGWGLLGEPALLGLVLAPTGAGTALVAAGVCAFFARHPLKLALSDRRRGSRAARTAAAEMLVFAYGLIALAFFILAVALGGVRPLVPLLAAAPLACIQLVYDARLRGRQLLPELAGGAALAALAPALLLAGGWATAPALAAGVLLAVKAAATVLYVRARLRLDRGQRPEVRLALAAHVGAVVVAVLLAAAGWAPWLGVAAALGLAGRAAHGLSPLHRVVRPRVVGLQELGFGIAFTAALALGYTWGF